MDVFACCWERHRQRRRFQPRRDSLEDVKRPEAALRFSFLTEPQRRASSSPGRERAWQALGARYAQAVTLPGRTGPGPGRDGQSGGGIP